MDEAFEAHRRYLAALHEACSHHPRPHSHQLAALEREISLAAAGDRASYRAANGSLFELTRAAWLDRAANQARVAVALGDRRRAEAAALEHAHALNASGHDDWGEHVAAGSTAAGRLRADAAEAASAFTRMFLALLVVHTTGYEQERAEWLVHATGAYQVLRAIEPVFAWPPQDPQYALRTPWTGSGLKRVGEWIAELEPGEVAPEEAEPGDALAEIEAGEARWRSELARAAPGPAGDEAGGDPAAPYRALAAGVTGDDHVAAATRRAAEELVAAGDAAGPGAAARFVTDGLLVALATAPLRARAEDALARQSVWPDPLVEQHWRALLDRLGEARTPTEAELYSGHADACFAVESDWNALLLGSLLAPLRLGCAYGWDGSAEARAALDRAAETTHALFGLGPRAVLGVPRVADLVARIVVPLVADGSGVVGAYEGEAGFDLLGEARNWVAVADGVVLRDAAVMRELLFDATGVPEPAPLPLPVTFWGAVVEPDDLVPALSRPGRPPAPGLES